MSCPISIVQIQNGCHFIKFIYTTPGEEKRIEYINKKNIRLQKTNDNSLWVNDQQHNIYIDYNEVSTTDPVNHNNLDELINIILFWLCLDKSVEPSNIKLDSTGRTKMSSSLTILNGIFNIDIEPLLFNVLINTSNSSVIEHRIFPKNGVYLNNKSMNIPGSNTDKLVFQSKAYLHYTAGSCLFITINGIIRSNSLIANFATARLGYFDDHNDKSVNGDAGGSGVFFEIMPNGDVYAVYRYFDSNTNNQIDNKVIQTQWNLDTMNGSGSSRVNIDFTLPQCYCIELEYPGSRVRLGFNINGRLIWAHQFLIYNTQNFTFYRQSLPVRMEIQNNAGSFDTQQESTMEIYDISAEMFGNALEKQSYNSYSFQFTVNSNLLNPSILLFPGQHRSLIAIRMNPLFCRGVIYPEMVTMDFEDGVLVLWRILLNPNGLSPVWQSVHQHSIVQFSNEQNDVTIGANSIVLDTGLASATTTIDISRIFKFHGLHASINGEIPDILCLSILYLRGNIRTRATISFKEIH